MPLSACAPCRQWKLRCDRRLPQCSMCIRGQRQCSGPAQQLSWPKPGNAKRFHVGPEPCKRLRSRSESAVKLRWTHVGTGDLVAHYGASAGQVLNSRSRRINTALLLRSGLRWTPTQLDGPDLDLLQYFQLEASLTITCDSSGHYLLSVITRLAFHDDEPSSQAILHAVLAISSLRRQGLNADAIGRKGKALHALELSARSSITGLKIAQHVAAGLLLCCFEIYGKDGTSGPWYLHLESTKRLLQGLDLEQASITDEFLTVTSCLYHHDVHAQFVQRHWRRSLLRETSSDAGNPGSRTVPNTKSITATVQRMSKLTGVQTSSHLVLWPLVGVFEHIVDPSDPCYHSVKYRRELEALERELESVVFAKYVSENDRMRLSTPLGGQDREIAILELYRLSALVYLERVSRNFSGTSEKLDAWVRQALDLVQRMNTVRYGFPIFIIGCEARTDEQRIVILDCIDATQKAQSRADLQIVKEMVASAWALEDLETERELDYVTKLDLVISRCDSMPSFA